MPDTLISGYGSLTSLAVGDLFEVVDISDTSLAASGTNKKITTANIAAAILATPTVTGHPTVEGVTATGATGTGNFVFSINPTFTGTANRFGTPTTNDVLADTMFSASATTQKALVIQAKATPTAAPFVVQQSDGTPWFSVASDGNVIIDQRTAATFANALDVKYQGTTQASIAGAGGSAGVWTARVGFNGGGGFFTTDASGNVVGLGTITGKHFLGNGTSPTVAGDGSSNGSIAGKDFASTITVGTGSTTTVTVTFGTAYATAPACTCAAQTTTTAIKVATTTTTAVLTTTIFTAGEKLQLICGGF